MTAPAPVLSEDRVGRLRPVLYVVAAVALLVVVLAVVVWAQGETAGGVVALVVGAVLLAASVSALRLLPQRSAGAKRATLATGVLCALAGLALAGSWLAFLLPLLGLGLLFLALINDDPATTTQGTKGTGKR